MFALLRKPCIIIICWYNLLLYLLGKATHFHFTLKLVKGLQNRYVYVYIIADAIIMHVGAIIIN